MAHHESARRGFFSALSILAMSLLLLVANSNAQVLQSMNTTKGLLVMQETGFEYFEGLLQKTAPTALAQHCVTYCRPCLCPDRDSPAHGRCSDCLACTNFLWQCAPPKVPTVSKEKSRVTARCSQSSFQQCLSGCNAGPCTIIGTCQVNSNTCDMTSDSVQYCIDQCLDCPPPSPTPRPTPTPTPSPSASCNSCCEACPQGNMAIRLEASPVIEVHCGNTIVSNVNLNTLSALADGSTTFNPNNSQSDAACNSTTVPSVCPFNASECYRTNDTATQEACLNDGCLNSYLALNCQIGDPLVVNCANACRLMMVQGLEAWLERLGSKDAQGQKRSLEMLRKRP